MGQACTIIRLAPPHHLHYRPLSFTSIGSTQFCSSHACCTANMYLAAHSPQHHATPAKTIDQIHQHVQTGRLPSCWDTCKRICTSAYERAHIGRVLAMMHAKCANSGEPRRYDNHAWMTQDWHPSSRDNAVVWLHDPHQRLAPTGWASCSAAEWLRGSAAAYQAIGWTLAALGNLGCACLVVCRYVVSACI